MKKKSNNNNKDEGQVQGHDENKIIIIIFFIFFFAYPGEMHFVLTSPFKRQGYCKTQPKLLSN